MTRLLLAAVNLLLLTGVPNGGECGSNNTASDLPARERYRRLIPYMTFYLHQDPATANNQQTEAGQTQAQLSRYQGYNQGYNHGFVHLGGPQRGFVPYRVVPVSGYHRTQTTAKSVVQTYYSGKQRQPPPSPPEFQTGFKPMEDPPVSIAQSQELPSRHYEQPPRNYYSESRQYPEDSNRHYNHPYFATPSPRPFVTVEPNSEPRQVLEPATPEPSTLHHYSTIQPQTYYSPPISNHIYPAPDPPTGYDISGVIPTRITSDNLESSIKTLSKLLQILQKANALPHSGKVMTKVKVIEPPRVKVPLKVKPRPQQPSDDEGGTPGRPGIDYPTLTRIPPTSFSCKEQRYKGFFGDPETNCQVWHYCDLNGGQASFLCPNGTIFSQVALTCDWWFNVKCSSTAQLYVLNERLYKYIIPQKPSFPEDFSGPLVDKYLEQKYRELESKRNNETSDESQEDDDAPPHETNLARSVQR